MILLWLILILFVGGLCAWVLGRTNPAWARWIALAALAIDLVLCLGLWLQQPGVVTFSQRPGWLVEVQWPWIPQFGMSIHLALDGLSLLLVILTCFLGLLAVAASWSEIQERVGLFHANVLWVLTGVMGVFLALDLLLFYVFWEVMLVPMYFLISLWGHENRVYAAIKFFIFTQASSLLMLVAILALALLHHQHTGVYTFDYMQLLGTPMAASTAMWLMLGFVIAFVVKLPAVPVHTWLPDAHTEAPTAGSVLLAGLLLKTGAYGLFRFVLPLFPAAAQAFAPVAMGLGVLGILYGALLAFAQTDVKRLVAYTSVSHMGFVLLGVFAWNPWALQGAIMEMLCHGLSTGGLFILAGALQERLHTRDLGSMGGLWSTVPRLGGVGMVLAMASLGLPGLGNFVAELLVLLGALVLVMSAHFIALFLGLELLSVALYTLFAYLRPDVRSLEAGIKYLLLAAASSAFLLFGMALIYAELGTMEFAHMVSWRAGESMVRSVFVLTGLALTLIGLGFKLAVVPFHMWTPDVYEGAPAPITAFVATVSKGAVVALLVRYLLQTGAATDGPVLLVLSLMAIASMVLGNVLALLQDNVKRLLAYSSIAQLGYLLVAFVAGGPRQAEAVTYYVVAYVVTTLCAFGCVTVLSGKSADADTFEAYRGLFWRRPGVAVVFAAALFSLAGIPLTAGFVGKLYVLAASVASAQWLLAVLVVLNSAMGLFYYLRLVIIMYAPLPQEAAVSIPHAAPSWSWAGGVVLAVLTTLLVWLGVYPAPFLDMIRATVASIL